MALVNCPECDKKVSEKGDCSNGPPLLEVKGPPTLTVTYRLGQHHPIESE